MRDLVALLERIAVGIERLVELSDHSKSSDTIMASQREKERKLRIFWLRVDTDERFPGLRGKITNPDFMISPEIIEAMLSRHDPVALVDHFTKNKALLARLYTLPEQEVVQELDAIERRLSLREPESKSSSIVSLQRA